jgi:hypothetical protein
VTKADAVVYLLRPDSGLRLMRVCLLHVLMKALSVSQVG